MADERYTLEETAVRFGRSKLLLALSIVPSLVMLAIGLKIGVLFFLFPLPIVIGFLARGTERGRVEASREGVRVGKRLVPRADLSSALVRHERGVTYVELRGRRELDIEVANNVEADALVRALGLDAASTTLDVPVDMSPNPFAAAGVLLGSVCFAFWLGMVGLGGFAVISFVVGMVVVFAVMGRATLRIGADGVVFQRRWGEPRFVSHDDVVAVELTGATMLVRETDGRETRVTVRGDDDAPAIARRFAQARQAHRASADAPELSIALDRGAHTTREWLADLRKLGEGTIATFRTIGIAREQLLDVVESTTAAAKDRVAALVALRPYLREEEKTRIRVATERIAAPEVRDGMVRVLNAEDDDAMIDALESVDRN